MKGKEKETERERGGGGERERRRQRETERDGSNVSFVILSVGMFPDGVLIHPGSELQYLG